MAQSPCWVFFRRGNLCDLGLGQETAARWIWEINERMLRMIPRPLRRLYGRHCYLRDFRKKAPAHAELSGQGTLHPMDYRIRFRDIDSNTFAIDFYECAMMKLCAQFDTMGLFPAICRMDYLISHYLGIGFTRAKTLGDGEDCCDCVYQFEGNCEWNPEAGFVDRK